MTAKSARCPATAKQAPCSVVRRKMSLQLPVEAQSGKTLPAKRRRRSDASRPSRPRERRQDWARWGIPQQLQPTPGPPAPQMPILASAITGEGPAGRRSFRNWLRFSALPQRRAIVPHIPDAFRYGEERWLGRPPSTARRNRAVGFATSSGSGARGWRCSHRRSPMA